jgi:hypothetical protein
MQNLEETEWKVFSSSLIPSTFLATCLLLLLQIFKLRIAFEFCSGNLAKPAIKKVLSRI